MKILHYYYDIMNLYGDRGNVSVLERLIRESGSDCEVCKKSFGDSVDFSDYDFIFIGSGTEQNQKRVLADFKDSADSLREYIESSKPALFTGNSFEMLGKTITDCDGREYEGLGIFDFTTREQNKTRMTADAVFESEFLSKPLVGFVNKCSEIFGVNSPAFTVKRGLGDNTEAKTEGIRENNFIGTHLTGPVLVKNPHLAEFFAEIILGKKSNTDCLELAKRGYDVTLSELTAQE